MASLKCIVAFKFNRIYYLSNIYIISSKNPLCSRISVYHLLLLLFHYSCQPKGPASLFLLCMALPTLLLQPIYQICFPSLFRITALLGNALILPHPHQNTTHSLLQNMVLIHSYRIISSSPLENNIWYHASRFQHPLPHKSCLGLLHLSCTPTLLNVHLCGKWAHFPLELATLTLASI